MQKPGRTPSVLSSEGFPSEDQRLEIACRMIAWGRHASRQIASQVRAFGLAEAEFRLLWELRQSRDGLSAKNEPLSTTESIEPELLNQTELGGQLGLSASQVSAVVERLGQSGHISGTPSADDRRQQLWRLTDKGDAVLTSVLDRLTLDPCPWQANGLSETSSAPAVKDAA